MVVGDLADGVGMWVDVWLRGLLDKYGHIVSVSIMGRLPYGSSHSETGQINLTQFDLIA